MKIKRLYLIGLPERAGVLEYGSRRRFYQQWSKENNVIIKFNENQIRTDEAKIDLLNDIKQFSPDTIFIYNNFPQKIFDVLVDNKKFNARIALWHCDWTMLSERWGSYYTIENPVDFLFVVSAGHVDIYQQIFKNTIVSYLPHEFANDYETAIFNSSFQSEVAFVGQAAPFISEKCYGDRKRFLRYLVEKNISLRTFPDMSDVSENDYFREYPKRQWTHMSKCLKETYGSGKIFLGIETKEIHETFCYFSNRPFITMGYGSFYLCWNSSGIEKMFEIKKHLDVFSSFEEGYDKILFYLKHDELRKQIAETAKKLVFEKHLTIHRCNDLITTIETEKPTFSGFLNA